MKIINKNFLLFEMVVGIISLGIIPALYALCNQIYTIDIFVIPTIAINLIAGIATWCTCKTDTWADLLMWQSLYLLLIMAVLLIFFNLLIRDLQCLSFSILFGIFMFMIFIPFAVLYCSIYTFLKNLLKKHKITF